MEKALGSKQENFCRMYAKCFDKIKAYTSAYGKNSKRAEEKAEKLLQQEDIRRRIKELKTARFNRELLEADDVIGMYIKIAFADVTDIVEFGKKTETDEDGNETVNNYINFKYDCGEDFDASAVSSISNSKTGWKVTFYDRMKALEWLAKHLGIGEENDTQEGKSGVIIVPEVNKELFLKGVQNETGK